jgi:hypothetical protein
LSTTEQDNESRDVPDSISQLVRSYQRRTGESLHRVSERSARSGHRVTQKYLWELEQGRAKGWPKNAATFTALAIGLETTELAIVLGYAVEFDIPVRMPSLATRLPTAIDQAPESVREAILGLAWAIATEGPVRRYLPDDEVPDVSGLEGVVEDEGPGAPHARHAHRG